MQQRLLSRVLSICLALSLIGNVWMLLENRRLLTEWEPSAQTSLQVHVLGAVSQPGVYVLEQGARVSDALRIAGGTLPEAELGQMNLAKPLFDGEQILVASNALATASAWSQGDATAASADGGVPSVTGLININTANATELDQLPYIGPSKAAAIVAYRQEHGAFARVEDLLLVSGIGEATLAKFKHLVTVK